MPSDHQILGLNILTLKGHDMTALRSEGQQKSKHATGGHANVSVSYFRAEL